MNKTATAIAKFRAKVVKSNAAFNKSTKAEKRVQIAKDVLEQLKLKRMTAEKGSYISLNEINTWNHAIGKKTPSRNFDDTLVNGNIQIQDILLNAPSCTVCALGAVFTATVERCDKFKVSDLSDAPLGDDRLYIDSGDMHKYLSPYFSRSQLTVIEDAFEGDFIQNDPQGTYGYQTTSALRKKAVDFNQDVVSNDNLRLTRIMKNIVKNNGTFKP